MSVPGKSVWASTESFLAKLSHKYKRIIYIGLVSLSMASLLVVYGKSLSRPTTTTINISPTPVEDAPDYTATTVNVTPGSSSRFDGTWDPRRDSKDFLLSSEQCDQAFPGLFVEVDRAVEYRKGRKIAFKDLDKITTRAGFVRAMIYEQELYIISVGSDVFTRAKATLHALHRAIITSPEPLPNIEFTFVVTDEIGSITSWSFTRRPEDEEVWLMPDFGFWSWPEPKIGSYGEVQRKIQEMEVTSGPENKEAWTWERKREKLVWRGAPMKKDIRFQLVEHTKDKDWADVKFLDWSNKEGLAKDLLSMPVHCQYKFVVHTEGSSYSGRLKYLQNCRSVVVAHKLTWIQHHHPLLVPEGPNQNFVEVKNNFMDLEEKIKRLLENDSEAKRIADNGVRTFRERYLTPAAEVCYWRKLIKGWAEVSFEPEFYEIRDGVKRWRGVPVESFFLMGKIDWEPY